MNKIVESQLRACVYADLNNYDSETNTYLIPRYSKPQYSIGKCYLIRLPKHIINNSNSIMAVNWNNGAAPSNEYYKAYVSRAIGKVIYVDCLAYDFEDKSDLNTMWSGYLNTDEITQVGEIK